MYAMLLFTAIFVDVMNTNCFVDFDEAILVLPMVIGVMYFIGMPRVIDLNYANDIFL